MNNLIYLAGPYSYNPALAFEMHMQYTAFLLKEGHLIFSPILHNHQLAHTYDLPTDISFWHQYNKDMLLKCDELMVIAERMLWQESKGVQHEIKIAKEENMPISYIAYCSELSVMVKSFNFAS